MDVAAAKTAVKDLIVANSATLLAGLTKYGEDRKIVRITTSNLSPFGGFYYIAIRIPDSDERSQSTASNMARPSRDNLYSMEIIVVDEAIINSNDAAPYEGMHEDFDDFTDGIINLIEAQVTFATNPTYRLAGDRVITKTDETGTRPDKLGKQWASLFARIRFTLECGTS